VVFFYSIRAAFREKNVLPAACAKFPQPHFDSLEYGALQFREL